jgi:hypothetical protein
MTMEAGCAEDAAVRLDTGGAGLVGDWFRSVHRAKIDEDEIEVDGKEGGGERGSIEEAVREEWWPPPSPFRIGLVACRPIEVRST